MSKCEYKNVEYWNHDNYRILCGTMADILTITDTPKCYSCSAFNSMKQLRDAVKNCWIQAVQYCNESQMCSCYM